MKNYKYTAINKKGRNIKGNIRASNENDLESRLKTIGLELITSEIIRSEYSFFSARIKSKDIIILCIQLEKLSHAGIELIDIISDLRDSTDNNKLKNILAEIYESIISGSMLSEALRKHPKIFDNIFVGLVVAGEKTGKLTQIFAYLSDHLKWTDEVKGKIKKASYYPLFLLILMLLIISLMMIYVIPQLSSFLLSQNFTLPIHTRLLVATSKFFQNYWSIFLITICSILLIFKLLTKLSTDINIKFDEIKLSLPVIGGIIRKIELARFCRFFSIMFKSGVDILESLEKISDIMNNLVLKNAVIEVRKLVSEGSSLADALMNTGQFPSLIIRMVKIGEGTGNIDSALENINYFYDREINDTINNMIALIQPSLTIIMGILMLWITLAVFGPLYSSFSDIKL